MDACGVFLGHKWGMNMLRNRSLRVFSCFASMAATLPAVANDIDGPVTETYYLDTTYVMTQCALVSGAAYQIWIENSDQLPEERQFEIVYLRMSQAVYEGAAKAAIMLHHEKVSGEVILPKQAEEYLREIMREESEVLSSEMSVPDNDLERLRYLTKLVNHCDEWGEVVDELTKQYNARILGKLPE